MRMNALHGFALVFFVALIVLALYPRLEGFTVLDDGSNAPTPQDGWDLSSHTQMENSHGSAPAGVHASPGPAQHDQNENAPHVSPVKGGNPQNVWPELKRQPSGLRGLKELGK
jgi:hypothetical protein